LLASAAIGQDAPESILPPGFNEPVAPTPTPAPVRPAPGASPAPGSLLPPGFGAPLAPAPTPTPTATPTPIDLALYELPDYARRSLAVVGPVGPDGGGLGANAFGAGGGPMTQKLMRALDTPLPSRWLSIALRRALVSRVATPAGVDGADFAAERAWLLLRMGEADSARAVVQSVDVENYTPKLFQVAMQAMLANGDPSGLCPLVDPAIKVVAEPGWVFARAMCAALAGKPAQAGALYDQARRRTGRNIDALLAEKVIGAGAQGRRSVTIEWDGVDQLTAWRFGLATATGVEIPAALFATVGPQVASWRATAPMLDAQTRVAFADAAASQGVLSNAAMVDLYSAIEAQDDSNSAAGAVARDLRAAYAEGGAVDRLRLLRQLWDEPASRAGKQARLILTARAAARIAPSPDHADDSSRLIAAMLTAGLDRAAVRWSSVVPAASDGWAMLALADPRRRSTTAGEVDSYHDSAAEKLKGRMLLAGLTGLGRLSLEDAQALAEPLDVRFGLENAWTRAITAAAQRGEGGSVLLLAAIGMQAPDWRGVPPEVLYHSCLALRAVGLEGEARMIAAEAIARL